jgi:acyl carrier protein
MSPLPTSEELAGLVRALLAEILETSVQEIPVEADLIDELDLDSLQQLELMTKVEQHLSIRLDIDDWRGGRNVLELTDRVRLRLERPIPG